MHLTGVAASTEQSNTDSPDPNPLPYPVASPSSPVLCFSLLPSMSTEVTSPDMAIEQPQEEQQQQQPAMTGLQNLRRIRRTRAQYDKLQRPAEIAPGSPTPSIEGWVVFLTNLPPETTVEDVQDLFVGFKAEDPGYFGGVREVKIPLDRNCQCPGHALVELDSREGCERACTELPGCAIPFYAVEGAEPCRLGIAPAFLAEEDEPADDEVTVPGEKRGRS